MAFSTDTRTIQPGDTYVAIRGETHDGHAFVEDAVAKGAVAVVVDHDLEADAEVIVAEDSVRWLVDRASAFVREVGCDVVGITGSVGKTTTRGAIVSVLSESFDVRSSEGNKNTPLGISLTVLNTALTPATKLVLEMGARFEGDIKELREAFPLTVGVATNVRGVHLETMGPIERIEREKSEIVRGLEADGTAVLNGDDPRTRRMAEVTKGQVILYGTEPHNDVRPEHVTADLPILGDHAIYTALVATAVGQAFGMPPGAITRGLEGLETEPGRLRKLDGLDGSLLIDDTYNASPDAARSALGVLAGLEGERRTAILGDMLELGETEVEQHVGVLEAALDAADRVVAVGEIMGRAAAGLEGVAHFSTSQACADAVRSGDLEVGPGDVVLVKGSQGARMERVSEALLAPGLEAADVLPRQTPQWKAIP